MGRSLWREDGTVVYNCCWPSPAQSVSGPSPVGLETIFFCLRFETSRFVASYDSQGYGGSIRPSLHTGIFNNVKVKVKSSQSHIATDGQSISKSWRRSSFTLEVFKIKSKSHYTDGQSISKSWCWAPSEAHDQIFITLWQLCSCFSGAPSLTRGQVCVLYVLLALASVVFLESEYLRTRDTILLSQIWDFTFRRLLRLAGSKWRYSNPPPQVWSKSKSKLYYDRRSVGQSVLE
jgi:hypothetical protein